MTANEFESIKNKIKKLELDSATAKGKMEAIQESWKKEYGFSTIEEAQEKLNDIRTDIEEKSANKEALMLKLETSFNWDSV